MKTAAGPPGISQGPPPASEKLVPIIMMLTGMLGVLTGILLSCTRTGAGRPTGEQTAFLKLASQKAS